MPRGRPRQYLSKQALNDARNSRRRERRQQPQNQTIEHDDQFRHSFLLYQGNTTTVTSIEPDIFTTLSNTFDAPTPWEHPDEEEVGLSTDGDNDCMEDTPSSISLCLCQSR